MPTNTYDDPSSADYIEKLRIEAAKLRARDLSNRTLLPNFIRPIDDSLVITDSVAAPVSATPDSYEFVDDSANQKLLASLNNGLLDGSGNANDVVVNGTEQYAAGPEISPDKFLFAFDFDGATKLEVPNESDFDRTNVQAFSVSFRAAWTTASVMVLISKMTAIANAGIVITAEADGKIRIRLINTATTNEVDVITTATYKDGVYRHFMITKGTGSNAAAVILYVDGVSVTLNTTTDNLSATIANNIDVNIGAYDGGTAFFTGQLEGAEWWNLEFSAAEALAIAEGHQHSENANAAIIGFSNVEA